MVIGNEVEYACNAYPTAEDAKVVIVRPDVYTSLVVKIFAGVEVPGYCIWGYSVRAIMIGAVYRLILTCTGLLRVGFANPDDLLPESGVIDFYQSLVSIKSISFTNNRVRILIFAPRN